MDTKYYTPNISEFHIGFEFQVFLSNCWVGFTWTKFIGFDNIFTNGDVKFTVIESLKTNHIRVKHLDHEDIVGCGWEETYINTVKWFTKGNYRLFISHKRISINKGNMQYFRGAIQNKSEFIFLMKSLGISNENAKQNITTITVSDMEKNGGTYFKDKWDDSDRSLRIPNNLDCK